MGANRLDDLYSDGSGSKLMPLKGDKNQMQEPNRAQVSSEKRNIRANMGQQQTYRKLRSSDDPRDWAVAVELGDRLRKGGIDPDAYQGSTNSRDLNNQARMQAGQRQERLLRLAGKADPTAPDQGAAEDVANAAAAGADAPAKPHRGYGQPTSANGATPASGAQAARENAKADSGANGQAANGNVDTNLQTRPDGRVETLFERDDRVSRESIDWGDGRKQAVKQMRDKTLDAFDMQVRSSKAVREEKDPAAIERALAKGESIGLKREDLQAKYGWETDSARQGRKKGEYDKEFGASDKAYREMMKRNGVSDEEAEKLFKMNTPQSRLDSMNNFDDIKSGASSSAYDRLRFREEGTEQGRVYGEDQNALSKKARSVTKTLKEAETLFSGVEETPIPTAETKSLKTDPKALKETIPISDAAAKSSQDHLDFIRGEGKALAERNNADPFQQRGDSFSEEPKKTQEGKNKSFSDAFANDRNAAVEATGNALSSVGGGLARNLSGLLSNLVSAVPRGLQAIAPGETGDYLREKDSAGKLKNGVYDTFNFIPSRVFPNPAGNSKTKTVQVPEKTKEQQEQELKTAASKQTSFNRYNQTQKSNDLIDLIRESMMT